MANSVSIILSLFNKSFEVEEMVNSLTQLLAKTSVNYEIILCNDGSTDTTDEICTRLVKSNTNVKYLSYSENRGRGFAVKHSIRHSEADYVLYLDSDFSKTTTLNFLFEAFDMFGKSDVILGDRFHHKSKTKRHFLRLIIGYMYRKIMGLFFPELKRYDIEVGFKAFRREKVLPILDFSLENRWSFDLEILYFLKLKKIDFHVIPLDWNEVYENYNSSVNIIEDSLSQLIGFFRIRFVNARAYKMTLK